MEGFFNPKSIAIFGASATPGKAGYNIMWNLRNLRLKNGIFPINPTRDEILGIKVFESIEDIPENVHPIDLAVICIHPRHVKETIQDCIKHGVKNIIIESGQLAETDEESQKVAVELKNMIEENARPPRIMGPNSIGVVDLHTGVNTSLIPFESLPDAARDGVAVVGQTGLIASGYLQRIFAEKTFPVSKICCLGNKFDINELDIMEYLRSDPKTKVIAIYLEDTSNGREFMEIARQCVETAGKPVVILKSGRSEAGARMVSSHTGSLAGDDKIFSAASSASGLTRVENFEEMWIQAQFFYRAGGIQGNRLGVISISGAGCALSADAAEQYGMLIPEFTEKITRGLDEIIPSWFAYGNPLDLWSTIEQLGAPQAYAKALEILLEDNLNAVLIVNLAMPESLMDWEHLEKMRLKFPNKPIYLSLLGGHEDLVREWVKKCAELNIPITKSPDFAIKTMYRAYKLYKWQERQKHS
ncbi:MAG: acetate--CoA ligase family protein [Candidatus Hodarchaeota archaeon]